MGRRGFWIPVRLIVVLLGLSGFLSGETYRDCGTCQLLAVESGCTGRISWGSREAPTGPGFPGGACLSPSDPEPRL